MALSKEDVLEATRGGLAVFEYFFGARFPGLKKPFLNPFYDDTNPSCYLFENMDSGVVYFMDFGDQDFQLDCFGFVGKVFNLQCQGDEFLQILEIIDRELVLGLSENHDRIRDGVWFFIVVVGQHRVDDKSFGSIGYHHVHVLEVGTAVLGNTKGVRNLKVGQDGTGENGKAIAVDAALAVRPAARRSSQLLQTAFIQFVLDVVVQEVPGILTGLVQGFSFQHRRNSLGVVDVFPNHTFHQVDRIANLTVFDDDAILGLGFWEVRVVFFTRTNHPIPAGNGSYLIAFFH